MKLPQYMSIPKGIARTPAPSAGLHAYARLRSDPCALDTANPWESQCHHGLLDHAAATQRSVQPQRRSSKSTRYAWWATTLRPATLSSLDRHGVLLVAIVLVAVAAVSSCLRPTPSHRRHLYSPKRTQYDQQCISRRCKLQYTTSRHQYWSVQRHHRQHSLASLAVAQLQVSVELENG